LSDYRPVREEATLESAETAAAEMLAARAHEANLKAQLQEATEASKAAEWKFHNCMKAARDSVVAQYGRKSSQSKSVGHKPRGTTRRASRKKKGESDKKGE
jgi:hypothetical protein